MSPVEFGAVAPTETAHSPPHLPGSPRAMAGAGAHEREMNALACASYRSPWAIILAPWVRISPKWTPYVEPTAIPDAVRSLLRDVTAAVSVAGVRSVVLSGSGSRGELIYSDSPSGVRWFSDLELTIVAGSLSTAESTRIEKRISDLEQRQLAIGARTFHIDVDFVSIESWRQPRRNFQAWETLHTGWILFGEDVRDQIQVEVDARTCVQSSLNRLWHLLLYLPEGVLRGRPSDLDREIFHYILHRATLDFPLWLLLEEGKLIAGFAGRQSYLEEHRGALSDSGFDVGELLDLVREAASGRAAPETARGLLDHYDVVLQWYVRMLRRSLGRAEIDEDNLPQLLFRDRAMIYPALGPRRKLWEIKLALEIGSAGRPFAALHWLGTAKQVKITGFLWAMHMAARGILSSDEAAVEPWLERAAAEMQGLWPKDAPLTEDGDLADRWAELRRRFFDFVVRYYRGLQTKRSYYELVLKQSSS